MVGKGNYDGALKLIVEKNPLPFITGTICPHHCADKCTRHFYEESIRIRRAKLTAAQNGLDALLKGLKPAEPNGKCVAVIGGGPAGMAAAFFLSRQGASVTLFEKRAALGGVVRWVIPEFRIGTEAIENDAKILAAMGVDIRLNTPAPNVDALFAEGYTDLVYAVGAWAEGKMKLKKGEAMNVIRFLEESKAGTLEDLGENVIVIGGGNTAMDAARAAVRTKGVRHVRSAEAENPATDLFFQRRL